MSAGRLIIVSGPSGVGKSTVLAELLNRCDLPLSLSVSATTRPPRPGEIDGQHYHFLSSEQFAARRLAGEFLECCLVYGKHWYGTLRATVAAGLQQGKWLILEIDVEGARKVVEQCPDAVRLFVGLPTLEAIERRLRDRGTEDEESIRRRLEVARAELACSSEYDHFVVNDEVARAAGEICEILKRSR
jgi:guanylate kinase